VLAVEHRLWEEQSDPAAALVFGPGGPEGVPVPPFRFEQEHFSGSQPCVAVHDARGRLWRIKWGHEVQPESFAVRFAAACGYFAEVTHYIRSGSIEGVTELSRAGSHVPGGTFTDARFELEDRTVRMLFNEHGWAWNDNPFIGSPQLTGLKIVVMLLSNWDTKDRRDVGRGSNTAIFEYERPDGGFQARYLITDWGGAMGCWGSNVLSRGRWDSAGFERQTAEFVTGVEDGIVHFGYRGQRTEDVAFDISVDHVRWFAPFADRLTEDNLRKGLLASGATDSEASQFARALRARIDQLIAVATSG
jgi:hypothetical protein